ncbi:PilZ domain-containing protein [Actinoplanes philippinensis]|uniref:PilZ domain-containing protein n=1 Tax=Actinoplanes philippinensis TaxID=35752 RepID=A0A1I2IA88_9ACTN|nr:PilZ domain-containing protein [Actinoplanes philippinensis]SFF39232.1 PilZ domain-containing protein [Actinoplanes philippinensis]
MVRTTEEPQPWAAPTASASLGGGPARACRVWRESDGTLRLNLTGFAMIGVDVALLWTQNGTGFSIVGTVVPPPDGGMPGVYMRVDQTVGAVDRRRSRRVSVQVPVVLILPSGQMFPGLAIDLSLGGARVIVDLDVDDLGEEAILDLVDGLAPGQSVTLEVALPDGPADFDCHVRGSDEPGDVRLLFVDMEAGVRDRLAAFERSQ